MANTSAIRQQAASTTYQLLAAQEPHKKVSLSMKNAGEGFGEKKSLSLNEKCWRGFWREKKVYLSMKNAGEGFGEKKESISQ